MNFKRLSALEWKDNIFQRIGTDWMLICAGKEGETNAMTASYGGFGHLFHKPVAHIYVRPERHTYSLIEKENTFSLGFFNDPAMRSALQFCGRESGKNQDKLAACHLTSAFHNNTPYIEQADVNVICRVIYKQDLDPDALYDASTRTQNYASGGIHRMYIGEIVDILQK